MIEKVVSGGQTGVDRAGLDAAMEAGIPNRLRVKVSRDPFCGA
jgi:hypothetical protein